MVGESANSAADMPTKPKDAPALTVTGVHAGVVDDPPTSSRPPVVAPPSAASEAHVSRDAIGPTVLE